MPVRLKKFLGGIVLVIGVMIYAFIVMIVGQVRLAEAGPYVQLAYFAVFGLIWIVPAAWLIRWMERIDRKG